VSRGILSTVAAEAIIYVELLGEGVSVWRPVAATPEPDGVYRLPLNKSDDERWAFGPGSRVRVERRVLEHGTHLVACAVAD
jgi:hypothetical protein